MKSAWRSPLVAVLVAVLLALTGYAAGRFLQMRGHLASPVELARTSDCAPLGRNCTVQANGVSVALRLDKPVSPLRPFGVAVAIGGVPHAVSGVHVHFEMTGMDMGVNGYRLTRADRLREDSPWVGRATLPVCSADRLDWVAVVSVKTEGARYRAHFPFRATPMR